MGRPQRVGRGKAGLLAPRFVSESSRISISDKLSAFRSGPDQVLTFEPNLSNHDRAIVHRMCLKLGLRSKSSGKDDKRCVSVFKKTNSNNKCSDATPLTFSFETQEVLNELFSRYPPSELESSIKEDGDVTEKSDESTMNHVDICFHKPQMNPSAIAKQIEELNSRIKKSPALQQIAEKRSKLPIASFKDVITSAVDSHQVVLIAGETGCGKSTQVPQFILDHMWSQHKSCKILCSQPRRISASSVAERVAAERGEVVGGNVGYQIRMEVRGGRDTSIMFCTNGVLLRKLIASINHSSESTGEQQKKRKNRKSRLDVTHIIMDEIHERDRNADFLLIILRDLLPSRPDLRLILMSATMDAESFSKYFYNCPIVQVPGFTYEVRTYYLEDILCCLEKGKEKLSMDDSETIGSAGNNAVLTEDDITTMDDAIDAAWLQDEFDVLMNIICESPQPNICNYQHSQSGASPLMVAAGKGRVDEVSLLLSLGANCHLKAKDGSTASDWARKEQQNQAAELISKSREEKDQLQSKAEKELLDKYMSKVDVDDVNFKLIGTLLQKICSNSSFLGSELDQGAILIFLPGWEDITRCKETLKSSRVLSDGSKFLLLPLHSMVPANEQKKVFKRPPPNVRKIILSTNIAETSVTIDDITVVIDSGFMKEKSYDPYGNVSTFQTSWISKASVKQREGRAGRCQPGVCFHLFSKARAASLPEHQIPEIKRTSLEEICLQVKLLNPGRSIIDFLRKALDPPLELSVRNAVVLLQEIGALNREEKLTELGLQLGTLPLHPCTSKMLLFAILMNCLDPALTIACASGYREPFVLPMGPDERKRALAMKMELISAYGGYSDHLAVVAAFDGWRKAKKRGSEHAFCAKYFVSNPTMVMLDGMRKQILGELDQKKLLSGDLYSCSLNACDPGILRAVLFAGLYPMVGILLPPQNCQQRGVVITPRGEKVRIHPRSTNYRDLVMYSPKTRYLGRPLLVFDEVTRSEALTSIKNCSIIKPYPLLMLATEVVVASVDEGGIDDEDENDDENENHDENDALVLSQKQQNKLMSSPDNVVSVVVDRWLRFEATSLDAAQLYCLRERLLEALAFKVRCPNMLLPPVLGESVFAIACMLSYDGDVKIEPSSASVHGTSHLNKEDDGKQPNHQKDAPSDKKDRKVNQSSGANASATSSGNKNSRGASTAQKQTNASAAHKPKGASPHVKQQYVRVRDGRAATVEARMEK